MRISVRRWFNLNADRGTVGSEVSLYETQEGDVEGASLPSLLGQTFTIPNQPGSYYSSSVGYIETALSKGGAEV